MALNERFTGFQEESYVRIMYRTAATQQFMKSYFSSFPNVWNHGGQKKFSTRCAHRVYDVEPEAESSCMYTVWIVQHTAGIILMIILVDLVPRMKIDVNVEKTSKKTSKTSLFEHSLQLNERKL